MCQQSDYTRVHRHEKPKEETRRGIDSFTASNDDTRINDTQSERQRVRPEPGMSDEFTEYDRRLVIEYDETAKLLEKGMNVEQLRRARARLQSNKTLSVEEREHMKEIDRMLERQEESSTWSLHDDFDEMITKVREWMTNETGTTPDLGQRERRWMAHTKRRLGLLRMKRKLALTVREARHVNAVFELEKSLKDDTDRFLYTWLFGADAPIDFETAKRDQRARIRDTQVALCVDVQWERMSEIVAKKTADYIIAIIDGREPGYKELTDIDPVAHRATCFATLDMVCGSFTAIYDGTLGSLVKKGRITEEVRQNSTDFIRNLYKGLRENGILLQEELYALLTKKTRDDKKQPTIFSGKNDDTGTDDDGDDNKESIGASFMKKMGRYLPTSLADITDVLIGWSIIGLILYSIMTFLSGEVTSFIGVNTTLQSKNITNQTGLMKTKEDGPPINTDVDIYRADAIATINELNLTYAEGFIKDRQARLHQAMGRIIGAAELMGDIDEYRGSVVNDELWDEFSSTDNFMDDHMLIIEDQMDKMSVHLPRRLSDFTPESIREVADDKHVDAMSCILKIHKLHAEYNVCKDRERKIEIFIDIRERATMYASYGVVISDRMGQSFMEKYMITMNSFQVVLEERITPIFNEMYDIVLDEKAKIAEQKIRFDAAVLEKRDTEKAYIKAVKDYNSTRQVASDSMIHSSTANIVIGCIESAFYTSSVYRLVYGTEEIMKFYLQNGLSLSWQSAFNFCSCLIPFALFLYYLRQTGYLLQGAARNIPPVRAILDEATWSYLQHNKTNTQIVGWLKELKKAKNENDRFIELSRMYVNENIGDKLYAQFAELIINGALDDTEKIQASLLKKINPVTTALRAMTGNAYRRVKYSYPVVTRLFAVAESTLFVVMTARMLQNAALAFMFIPCYMFGSHTTVSNATAVALAPSGEMLLGGVAASTAVMAVIAYYISGIMKNVFMAMKTMIEATKTVSKLTTARDTGEFMQISVWFSVFMLSSTVHSLLLQSGVYGLEYEAFIDHWLVSPSKNVMDDGFSYSIRDIIAVSQRWLAYNGNTPQSKNKRVVDTLLAKENADKAYTIAKTNYNSCPSISGESKDIFIRKSAQVNGFLVAIRAPLDDKIEYLYETETWQREPQLLGKGTKK